MDYGCVFFSSYDDVVVAVIVVFLCVSVLFEHDYFHRVFFLFFCFLLLFGLFVVSHASSNRVVFKKNKK